ncbi:MAG: hypothetical protein K8W52_40715 [Deltaproteobacteria bacterium]|nr:hypothetical protein [Deltaproteobacteria bacterium]
MRPALTLVVLAALARAAVAQPDRSAPAPKRTGIARALSIGGTALGAGLVAYTIAADPDQPALAAVGVGMLVVGPGTGHVYAGAYGHAIASSAIRLGGVGLLGVGYVASHNLSKCACDEKDPTAGRALMATGAIALLGATIWDLVDAPRAVRRANARARDLAITPTIVPAPHGALPGVAITGTF